MDSRKEIDEQDVRRFEEEKQEISRGWRPSPETIRAIQGGTKAPGDVGNSLPEQSFRDAQGRDLTLRTHRSGDQLYVRVDPSNKPVAEDRPTFGDCGRANLHLERDENGHVTRARLQDIETADPYRSVGVGSHMLEQAEAISREQGAGEIYGIAPDDQTTREWYIRRGYEFRKEGREIYKRLSQ